MNKWVNLEAQSYQMASGSQEVSDTSSIGFQREAIIVCTMIPNWTTVLYYRSVNKWVDLEAQALSELPNGLRISRSFRHLIHELIDTCDQSFHRHRKPSKHSYDSRLVSLHGYPYVQVLPPGKIRICNHHDTRLTAVWHCFCFGDL